MSRVEIFHDREGAYQGVIFDCPGCGFAHSLSTDWTAPGHSRSPYADQGPQWHFDGNLELPTLSPSVLARGVERLTDEEAERVMAGELVEPRPMVCHSFVRAGRIEFLQDCTHALAGQTVDLPEVDP